MASLGGLADWISDCGQGATQNYWVEVLAACTAPSLPLWLRSLKSSTPEFMLILPDSGSLRAIVLKPAILIIESWLNAKILMNFEIKSYLSFLCNKSRQISANLYTPFNQHIISQIARHHCSVFLQSFLAGLPFDFRMLHNRMFYTFFTA